MIEVTRFDQVEAAERLLGLDERPIGYDVIADRRRGGRRLERVAAENLAAVLANLPGEPAVRLHHLLEKLLVAAGVPALGLINQDRVLGHVFLLRVRSDPVRSPAASDE